MISTLKVGSDLILNYYAMLGTNTLAYSSRALVTKTESRDQCFKPSTAVTISRWLFNARFRTVPSENTKLTVLRS
jgi:hypothetical protein